MNDVIKRIREYSLDELMGEQFGKYSKYIIQDRAIPDVRDGLKPVQRRILYAMYKNGNTFDKKTVKSALTVGDVIGKYHPHGDSSVYDAMTRMSQNWKQREPYIVFQGNNGSIDGDTQAAYRYTEAKLSKISNEMLRDINKDSVIFAPTFDDSRLEPTVLPARFPALLVNGSTGISAGYATNIPPHNIGEIIDATIKRIDSPNCKLETIMDIVKGPDFPTGGTIEGLAGIKEAYETGKGKIIVRAKYEFVKNKNKDQIVITEIPYEVTITNIVKKIEEIRIDKKIDGITEARNESGKEGLRIVVDLKSGADKNFVLMYLLKNTDLQVSYNFNVVAVVNRRPKLLGILQILDAYIAHQKDVITRRTKFDLAFAKKEFHITEGLVKALGILDEVIKVIRSSKNRSDAENNLVNELDFTMEQSKAIVALQLYRLTNTDVSELLVRLENLKKIIAFLTGILDSEETLDKVLKDELKAIKKEFNNPRRSIVVDEITEIKIDAKEMIPKENCVVLVTNEGYIKRVSLKSYSSSNEPPVLKPLDYVTGLYQVNTLDTILIFTNQGRYIYLPVHTITDSKWKEIGKHINNYVMLSDEETVVGSIILEKNQLLTFITKNGLVKQSLTDDFIVTRYSKPMTSIKLKEDDELVSVNISKKKTLFVSSNGYYLYMNTREIPIVGPKASGVKGMGLTNDFIVSGTQLSDTDEYVVVFTNQKTAKRIKVSDLSLSSRTKKGSTLIKKVKTVNYLITKSFVAKTKEEFAIKCDGQINELKIVDLSIMDLVSTGSSISKYDVEDAFKITELIDFNNKEEKPKDVVESSEEVENLEEEIIPKTTKEEYAAPKGEIIIEEKQQAEEMTLDDFLDDFKI